MLTPAAKLVRTVKILRPDIWLATFKTTCGNSESAMMKLGEQHKAATGSDAVIINDVVTHKNIVLTNNSVHYVGDDRAGALRLLLQFVPTEPQV